MASALSNSIYPKGEDNGFVTYGFIKGWDFRQDEIDKLRAALEFYADLENWDADQMIPTCWDDGNIDLGKRARKALEGAE